jgi:hypothetical protein
MKAVVTDHPKGLALGAANGKSNDSNNAKVVHD